MSKIIYKISPSDAWKQAVEEGVFLGAPIDKQDGFIHFSTAEQVAETAAKHFSGQSDLMLVVVDTARLGDALKWEPSRGGALFPHLYAPLAMEAVRLAEDLPLGPDGVHVLPESFAP
jgi:uncharacterized protein (DUF952 family)